MLKINIIHAKDTFEGCTLYNVHINDIIVNGINIVHSNEITENLTPLNRAFKKHFHQKNN